MIYVATNQHAESNCNVISDGTTYFLTCFCTSISLLRFTGSKINSDVTQYVYTTDYSNENANV